MDPNLSIYQIFLALIALFFIMNRWVRFAKKEKGHTFFKFTATLVIWGSMLVFSLFPSFTHVLSMKLGFGENLNTLIFLGFVVVFFIIFKLLDILERIECNITEIVRKEALNGLSEHTK